METKTPQSIQAEHESLHAELARAVKAGGSTGEAARAVLKVLQPHMAREEEFVAPALAACAPSTSDGETPRSEGPVSVPTADVPVGSGTITGSVVVTQPTAGEFKAFDAVCTHQACLVARVDGDQIHCTCHGSIFSAVDGSVDDPALASPGTAAIEGVS